MLYWKNEKILKVAVIIVVEGEKLFILDNSSIKMELWFQMIIGIE